MVRARAPTPPEVLSLDAALVMLQVTAGVLALGERVAAGDEGARDRVEELAELLRK